MCLTNITHTSSVFFQNSSSVGQFRRLSMNTLFVMLAVNESRIIFLSLIGEPGVDR